MSKYQIIRTKLFEKWLRKQSDELKMRIDARLENVAKGNFGDYKWFGEFGELRFFFGKGYRIYFTIKNQEIILLLLAGDKTSQNRDFKKLELIIEILKNR